MPTLIAASAVFLLSVSLMAKPDCVSGLSDQVSVEVTAYNNNLGLVKDHRKIRIPAGEGVLQFRDVASRINPVSVHIKSENGKFSILEQNYEYDLISKKKLLDKYVGKKIKIIDFNQYKDTRRTVDAVLLSNNDGPVFRIGKQIFLGHPGIQVLPELPEDLIATPTLSWVYQNRNKFDQTVIVSYLTEGIDWKCDYVLVLDRESRNADLTGWVSLENHSGATYRNAALKLVAGDVNRARAPRSPGEIGFGAARAKRRGRPSFGREALFEYHMYDLERKTTIKDNQTKQIELMNVMGVKVEKELLVYGEKIWFTRRYYEKNNKQPVWVNVKFKNAKQSGLGEPLPEGVVRVYMKDSKGKQQFVGEDRVGHTPVDEEIRVKTGKAFDVVAERRQVDYKQISTQLHESAWEIKVRNRKKEKVSVGVVEPLYGNWKMVKHNLPYEKSDAFTVRFDIQVEPGKEVKVEYRVRVGLE